MRAAASRLGPYPWLVLGTLLAALFASAFVYDRVDWPRPALLAGEATYLMQAESLAHDLDLAYTRRDFDRALIARHGEPPDLELASGSGGRRIAYDRPFPYALWLAPFVRLWPAYGFVAANLVLLAFVAVFAVAALEPVLGAAAPAWVALFLFASVAWSYAWLATGDLFVMAAAVVAFGLVARVRAREGRLAGERRRNPSPACFAAGALLAVPLATEPLYGLLAVAGFFAVPRGSRSAARGAYLLGLAASLAAVVGLQWWWSGGLHFFATTRFRFTPATGFPLVDFPAADWTASIRRFHALYWDEAPRLSWGVDPLLWLWDALYLAVGRHIGLLPYFLPLLVLAVAGSFRGWRRPIAIAAGVWLAAMIVLHPFNLYGGEGAIANRLFLPLYGSLWFVVGRPPRAWWGVAVAALSGLFLWNLWTSPWTYPPSPSGGYRYVTPVAAKVLPYETSQRWLPANQTADLMGLRLRLLNEGVWAETRHDRLMLDDERRARMVIASPEKLPSLTLELGPEAPSRIELRGARVEEQVLLADGGISYRLRPDGFVRRHATWWTPERQWIYRLDFELPRDPEGAKGPLAFRLFSEALLEEP